MKAGTNLIKTAWAILDEKGRLAFDDSGGALIYKTKIDASLDLIAEQDEKVVKVNIVEVK